MFHRCLTVLRENVSPQHVRGKNKNSWDCVLEPALCCSLLGPRSYSFLRSRMSKVRIQAFLQRKAASPTQRAADCHQHSTDAYMNEPPPAWCHTAVRKFRFQPIYCRALRMESASYELPRCPSLRCCVLYFQCTTLCDVPTTTKTTTSTISTLNNCMICCRRHVQRRS